MPQNLIEFHCVPYLSGLVLQDLPQPVPAAQGVSPRIKKIPAEIVVSPQDTISTVKKCPPFLDAMTSGYLIPAVADVEFTMHGDRLEYKATLPIVENHDMRQLSGTDIHRMVVIKFLNPWIVTTPPGYSCLFVNPLNRFDIPFQALSGVVETDTFYHEVNLPALCLLGPGQSFHLKKGTPLVQVIPFRREEWASQPGEADMARRQQWEATGDREGRYKLNNWQRKKYE